MRASVGFVVFKNKKKKRVQSGRRVGDGIKQASRRAGRVGGIKKIIRVCNIKKRNFVEGEIIKSKKSG